MDSWALFFSKPVLYSQGMRIQEALVKKRIRDEIPNTFLFLEHEPVITLGRRGRHDYVLDVPEGVEVVTSSRGGDVTYHAPGQLVLYPILRIESPSSLLFQLEETAMAALDQLGIKAFRREGMAGAWTSAGKIAAIGLKFKQWVSFHGLSLNVNLDMRGFDNIVGCGLKGEAVTSLEKLLGDRCPSLASVRKVVCNCLNTIFETQVQVYASEKEFPLILKTLVLPEAT